MILQPYAYYAAFCHGLSSMELFFLFFCSTFLLKILLDLFSFLVFGSNRKPFAFPVRLGDLGVFDPLFIVLQQHSCSIEVNAGLVTLIIFT